MSVSTLTPLPSSSSEDVPIQFGDYTVLKILGEGVCGKVAKCTHNNTGEIVAVKIFHEDGGDMEWELKIHNDLKDVDPEDANIVRCVDHFSSDTNKCLVFEILDCSLADLLEQGKFSLNELRPVAQQLLKAFEALKEANVVYTDLKFDNVMLVNHQDQPFKVKLIDFGCGYPRSELEQGTLIQPEAYCAPEVLLGAPLSEAVDMWSLGCILAEGFLNEYLFSQSSSYDHLRTIGHLLGHPSEEVLNRGIHTNKFYSLEDNEQWSFKSPQRYNETNWEVPEIAKMPLDDFSSLEEAVMVGADKLEPNEHLDLLAFLDFLKHLLHTDSEKRLTPSEALRHPFITMDHLTSPCPYRQQAQEMMTVTLQPSGAKATPEDHSSDQDKETTEPRTPGTSLGVGNQASSIHRETSSALEADDVTALIGINGNFTGHPCQDKEQHSCVIEMTQIMDNFKLSGEKMILISPELDETREDRSDRDSASYWSNMKGVALYIIIVFLIASSYHVTGSLGLSVLVILSMLYKATRVITTKMYFPEAYTLPCYMQTSAIIKRPPSSISRGANLW